MSKGIESIVHPVQDLTAAKAVFSALLGGAEPYVDEPYYVGFKVGELDLGLDPNGHRHGMTPYWTVDDINASLRALLDAGAEEVQAVKDVGGGKLIASVKDANGNIIGLAQSPS
jgi:predicted enzyme related to lactoylglutathione lyase